MRTALAKAVKAFVDSARVIDTSDAVLRMSKTEFRDEAGGGAALSAVPERNIETFAT
eukprot:CAMPEP_0184342266 /NCGR_PEP_ID=MMETSP1089-20130417/10888_1 /TAXON_ID=38269 ORGANISM="Gloeochaete wittrockiana, Strain SAG46.84" /NCGR_SAMPLE_ID=MMETSP1089 /ASSEMBLY_ACC=CAM_ASM_000445 /LENGTH=56 /DNA_ID=CAMNT_0026671043 /DNA_START=595 /DNA_END=765 /DNA_ORIENTATION=+